MQLDESRYRVIQLSLELTQRHNEDIAPIEAEHEELFDLQ